ncbi:hypothetical protein CEQ90_03005 [Lewinellaceae bacterium SD302]|nr:hypothetical protein CEQ90_03005 [Lewinellaceae bacterium SD302]
MTKKLIKATYMSQKYTFFFNKSLFLSLSSAKNAPIFVLQSTESYLNNPKMNKGRQPNQSFGGRPLLTMALTALLCLTSVFGQGFEISFGGPKEDQGVAILQMKDHGYMQVGWTEGLVSDDNDIDIFIVRTDVDGTVIWSRTYDEGFLEQPSDILPTADGNFLIAGYRIIDAGDEERSYLLKITPQGDVIWSQTYGTAENSERTKHILEVPEGGYLITGTLTDGSTSRQDVLLIRVDENGDELWRSSFGSSRDEEGIGAVLRPGGYLIGANGQNSTLPQPISDNDIRFYGVDVNGAEQWSKTYGVAGLNEQIEDIIPTTDGNLVVVGSANDFNTALMAKADLNGDTLWYTEVPATPFDSDLRGVIEEDNGATLVAAGQAAPDDVSFNLDVLMVKIESATGQLIYQRLIGDDDVLNTAEDLAPTVRGGYAIAAYNAQNAVAFNDMTIFKTNRDGEHLTNHVRGRVHYSADGCNDYQPGDLGLEGWLVRAEKESATFFGSTDSLGRYDLQIDTGTYTVSLLQKNDRWDICNPVAIVVDFEETYDSTRQNFALTPAVDCPLLEVELSAGPVIACSTQKIDVTYGNQGTVTAEGVSVVIELDEILVYQSSSVPVSSQNGQLLTFDLPDLAPEANGSFEIIVSVGCAGIVNQQSVATTATILPDFDCAPVDPDWNGSSIQVSSVCDGDSVTFNIVNPTDNPIQTTLSYIVIEDQVMIVNDPIIDEPMVNQTIRLAATGATYRLIAEQVPGHPGEQFPTTVVEGCTENGGSNFTTGQVAQFSDNDGDLNIDILTQEVFVLDPEVNLALRAYPKGYLDSIITPETELEYTIIFTLDQDADTFGRVVIRDTLSELLNLNSLEMGAASHPYDFTLYQNGVLKITFDSIHLLAGGGTGGAVNSDQTQKGYVTYRLSQKPNNAIGSVISNRAAVYFDYRSPELSEEVRHVVNCQEYFITDCLLTSNTNYFEKTGVTINVFPNPMKDRTTVRIEDWKGNTDTEFELRILDMFGREIRRQTFQGDQVEISRQNLPKASYIYELRGDGIPIGKGKLFVQ